MRCLTDKGWDEALEADLQFFATNTRMGKPARDCLSAKSFRKLLRLRDFAEYQSRWELEGVGDHDPVTVEPACMMDGGCSRFKAAFVQEILTQSNGELDGDIFKHLRCLRMKVLGYQNMCAPCRASIFRGIGDLRESFWREIQGKVSSL